VVVNGQPVRILGRGALDWSQNTTANLYSHMVMQNVITPNELVSPLEVNAHVSTYDAYDYNAYDPAASVYWDPGLRCDLDDVAHASYAHTALCGERYAKQWVNGSKNKAPVLCLRGPASHRDTDDAFTKSPTLRFMEPHDQWVGNVVFADGHRERYLEPFKMHAGTYDQFFETRDPASSDLWLGIFVAASENDATPVFDPLME